MGLDQAIHVVTNRPTDIDISPILVARIFKHFVTTQKFDVVLLGKLVCLIENILDYRLLMIAVNKQHKFFQECLIRL